MVAHWATAVQEWAARTCPSIPAREQSNQGIGTAPALSSVHLPGDGDRQRLGHQSTQMGIYKEADWQLCLQSMHPKLLSNCNSPAA